METNTKVTNYGKCRFCFSKGNHRDVMKEYNWNGIREVYCDILQECFNIYLSTSADRSPLICTSCVERLRDASSFRMLVVRAEHHLVDALRTIDEKQTLFVNIGEQRNDTDIGIKEESEIKRESDADESIGCPDDDVILDDNESTVSDTSSVDGEAALLARFPPHSLVLPNRDTLRLACPIYTQHLDTLKDKRITARMIEELLIDTPKRSKRVFLTEKIAHISNVTTILQNSNVIPFKTKTRAGFPCFYCRKIFDNFDLIQNHQETNQCMYNIRKLLSKFTADSIVVYVYVNNLKCTVCDQLISNYNDLKNHLTRYHNKKIYTEFGDRVIPFKLSPNKDFQCQVCGFNFETFGAIERHMNVHYRNYVCDQCGAGYVTKHRLKVHITYSHENGRYPCEICKKVYTTRHKYKSHVDAVHKMIKKNKCTKCPERFADYFNRHKHMVEVHGLAPLRYKCNVCDTPFKRRYALSVHMKRRHLEVRDVQCQLCAYKCYTTTELKVHMIKHNGLRTYECTVCKKSYARKKTLKEHMRIHNNDRRFACVVCGQAFIQNCSLKGHMRTHHSDYVELQ